MWAHFYGDTDSRTSRNPEKFTNLDFIKLIPKGYNYTSVMEEYLKDESGIKIIKDYPFTVKSEDYHRVVTDDSINIVLIRKPANVFTSLMPVTKELFYDSMCPDGKPSVLDFVEIYSSLLDIIDYVHDHCAQPAFILTG